MAHTFLVVCAAMKQRVPFLASNSTLRPVTLSLRVILICFCRYTCASVRPRINIHYRIAYLVSGTIHNLVVACGCKFRTERNVLILRCSLVSNSETTVVGDAFSGHPFLEAVDGIRVVGGVIRRGGVLTTPAQ